MLLDPWSLRYYETQDTEPGEKGIIIRDDILRAYEGPDTKKGRVFHVSTPRRLYKFWATTHSAAKGWVTAINRLVRRV